MPSPAILTTGANRDIGFNIIQATAFRVPTATYVIGSRSQAAGEEAISELEKQGVTATLDILVLDITSDDSILACKEILTKKYGHLDSSSLRRTINTSINQEIVLVNKAGIAFPQPQTT